MFSSDPSRYSPYSPSSRLFLNSLYAAPGVILGERALRLAIDSTGLAEELHELEQLSLIDWPRAARAKYRLLRALYEGFRLGDHPLARTSPASVGPVAKPWKTIAGSKPCRPAASPAAKAATGANGRNSGDNRTARRWPGSPRSMPKTSSFMPSANG